MKKHLNPPQNVGVFNKTAGIYNAATGSIAIGTALGLLTEYAILRHILNTHLTQFWQAIPPLLITAAAAGICIFLAVERIRYAKEASKILIDHEARQLGLAANGIVFAACIAIFGVSVALSYIGTIDTVNNTIKAPDRQTTAATDSVTAAKLQAINRQYSTDSMAIAKQWQARIAAETARHTGEIKALQAQVTNGKHWLKPKLEAAQNAKNTAINALKAERATALLQLSDGKQQQMAVANTVAANELHGIQSANNTAAARYEYLVSKASTILPIMVLVALLLIALGCFIVEKFKYKSGIKEVILPNEYDLMPSLFAEYKEALTAYFSGILRTGAAAIRRRAIPATETVNGTAAELVRLEMERYKEKILNIDQPAGNANAPTKRKASDLTTPPETVTMTMPLMENSRNYGSNGNSEGINGDNNDRQAVMETIDHNDRQAVIELLNTYKIHRQRLQAYRTKQRNGEGKPETITAGIATNTAAMETAEAELKRHGYGVYLNKAARKIELVKL